MIGQRLGHCRVVALIGEGGMGVVYRAHDEVLDRDVAVKVLKKGPEGAGGRGLLEEARASSALTHPNICTVHSVGESEGELYIVMELVEGQTLHAMCRPGPLAAESVLRYGIQIASALARAHDRGIVHGDLKSANVVITPEGQAKVLDFGLARRLEKTNLEGATRSFASREEGSSVSGTLAYMAPEILRGESAGYGSDLWALGILLYEAAAGRLPFEGTTGFETSAAILREMPAPLGPPVPPGLWATIQRCLAKEPGQRYQRAGEVQAALEAVQSTAILAADRGADRSGPRSTVLHSVRHLRVKRGDVLLLVGTNKGAFLLRSNGQRSRWEVGGPFFHGHTVYAVAYDGRGGQQRIWASTQSYWGTTLRSSDDFGRSWTNPAESPVRFPLDTGASLKNIWQILPGWAQEPQTLYCGVEPAALFRSEDGGETWALERSLWEHPHRPRWMPGNGGLALHTIVLDPEDRQRMYVAISSGGVYRTVDGGQSWTAQNRGIRTTFLPNRYPEFGQCVHKIAMHPAHPERLFLQNHWGLYRSDDYAENWTDIANGVPSDFGFAIMTHPRHPAWVYVVPVESDEFRCACDGKLRVYRTRNAGGSWEPLMRGLPQKSAYETVLRDAMTTDSLEPTGIYFGTRSGELFGSQDEGKTWERVVAGLPSILCVRCVAVEDGAVGTLGTPGAGDVTRSGRKRSPTGKARGQGSATGRVR